MQRTHLKDARVARHLTALDLAEITGIGEDRIYSIERGRYKPNRQDAVVWALTLGMAPAAAFPEIFSAEGAQ